MRREAGSLWLLCLLAGCTVGPDYRKEEPAAPAGWQAAKDAGLEPAGPEALKNWWRAFGDRHLDRLMDRALAGNLDLKIALARVDQARAGRRAANAELFPQIAGRAGAQRNLNLSPIYSRGLTFDLFELGFDAVWEIDLFGRLRRRSEAARADLEAAEEEKAQALVTLTAELARTYVEYRNLQGQHAITAANLEGQRHTLRLTERLYGEGAAARHDVVRARAQAGNTEAQLPALEAQMVAALRRLEVLAGQRPGALAGGLAEPAAVPAAPGRALLASPADTLRRRPDLRAAERRLAAATALQGAAVAELFPKVSLSAFLGQRDTDLETLFKSAAFSYSAGSNLLQPLLNFGRIQAGIDLAQAKQKEAYLAYQKAVLEALAEAETALSRYLKGEARRQTLAQAAEDQREAVRLARLRYQEGASSFLDVLDAQRALYLAEIELARAGAEVSTSLIAFYKALGGGADLAGPAAGRAASGTCVNPVDCAVDSLLP